MPNLASMLISRALRVATRPPFLPTSTRKAFLTSLSDELLINMARGDQVKGSTNEEMVHSLVEAGFLHSKHAIDAMLKVDRSGFVKQAGHEAGVYDNKPLPLGFKATISTPQFCAEVLELLSPTLVRGGKFLDIGCGSGYLSTLMSVMASAGTKKDSSSKSIVLGVDCFPDLVDASRNNAAAALRGLSTYDVSGTAELYFRHLSFPGVNGDYSFFERVTGSFDCIYVAPCIFELHLVNKLFSLVEPGGRLLVPYLNPDQPDRGQRLLLFDRGINAVELNDVDVKDACVMPVLCQPLMDTESIESVQADASKESVAQIPKSEIQDQLKDWVDSFEKEYGRKPNRQEMVNDAVGGKLFELFAAAK